MGITLKNNKSVTKNMTIKGDDGVGIKTITSGTPVVTEEKTTTPIIVTLTDETTQNFNVEAKNGSGADNALTKPTTAPSATQIVAVDNTNSQKMLTIGDGLNISNETLNSKLYLHSLTIELSDYPFTINVITNFKQLLNSANIKKFLKFVKMPIANLSSTTNSFFINYVEFNETYINLRVSNFSINADNTIAINQSDIEKDYPQSTNDLVHEIIL